MAPPADADADPAPTPPPTPSSASLPPAAFHLSSNDADTASCCTDPDPSDLGVGKASSRRRGSADGASASGEAKVNMGFVQMEDNQTGELKTVAVDFQQIEEKLQMAPRRGSLVPPLTSMLSKQNLFSGLGGGDSGGSGHNGAIRRGSKEFDLSAKPKESALQDLLMFSQRRLIGKHGYVNVKIENLPKRTSFLKDFFTTAIDMPWRYTILAFAMSFFISWFLFAVIWWIICYAHGDFEPDNLPGGINQSAGNFTPCVWAIHNFASCYLFSLETQHTIGYGSRQTSEECWEAIFITSLQSVIGVLISSCMAGVVFAKLARPKGRTHTVIFSKNAVITMQNGVLQLILRVGNIRKSHLIEAHVRAQIVYTKRVTKEGETQTYTQRELKVSTTNEGDEPEDRTTMFLPTTIRHTIDEDSPFYKISPMGLRESKFELVVVLEGIIEPTGNSAQVRTSFLPREILWAHRFDEMTSYNNGSYVVDCSFLNSVHPDEHTPKMSMEDIDKMREREEAEKEVKDRLKSLSSSSSSSSLSAADAGGQKDEEAAMAAPAASATATAKAVAAAGAAAASAAWTPRTRHRLTNAKNFDAIKEED